MNAEMVMEEYKKVLEGLAIKSPVLYLFSKNLRIEYVDYNPAGDMGVIFAATDGRVLYLYRPWMELESELEKLFVVVHELYHVFGLHPVRAKEIFEEYEKEYGPPGQLHLLINIACDAKVNYWIREHFLRGKGGQAVRILKTYDFSYKELEHDSVEELFKKLLNKCEKIPYGYDIGENDVIGGNEMDNRSGSGGERYTIQEGKEGVQGASDEELEAALKKAIAESILSAKNAGCSISALEEAMLKEILENQIDWKTILRQDIVTYIKKSVIGTWVRPNRRHEMLIGQKQIGSPKIWMFIDVSGSVWGDEVMQFISQVAYACKEASEINVVMWDTKVTNEYKVKKPVDVKKIVVSGGGGTTFKPVLEEYKGRIKPSDYMFVFTDTYWFDANEIRNSKMLDGIRARKVLVKTVDDSEIDDLFDKVIRIQTKRGR